MRLKCMQDNCPDTGQMVDMLLCCGAHSWSEPCKYYGRKPWSEYMYATCEHPGTGLQTKDLQNHYLMMLDIEDDVFLCYDDINKSQEVSLCCAGLAELLKDVLDDSSMINEIEKELVYCGVLCT